MELMGKRLDQAQAAYGDAFGQLARGRGNVLSQVETLKDLGAKATKSIGADFDSDDDDAASRAPDAVAADDNTGHGKALSGTPPG